MLIYIQGTDSFLAKRAIDQLKAKYLEKNPTGSELLEINADDQLPNWADLRAVPLFATSRLVIIKNVGALLAGEQQNLASFVNNLPNTTVAVVWDGKKVGQELATALKAAAKTIAAEPLSETALRRHLKARAMSLGFEVTPEQLTDLLESGGDLWYLENELHYLATAGETNQQKKVVDEPFAYFNLIRRSDWTGVSRQLRQDYRLGKPFELVLGSLAAAVRKELRPIEVKRRVVELLGDVDFGIKTGVIDQDYAIALLSYHLSNPTADRVEWEKTWEEIQA